MLCVDCRCLTLEGSVCERCGKPLPELAAPPRIDFKAPELKRMTTGYRCGDVTRVALIAYLEAQEESIYKTLEETEPETIPSDALAELREELDTGRRALMLYGKALDMVRQWISTGSNETLKVALGLVTQSDGLINDAIAMNFETNKSHIEAMTEYIKIKRT